MISLNNIIMLCRLYNINTKFIIDTTIRILCHVFIIINM